MLQIILRMLLKLMINYVQVVIQNNRKDLSITLLWIKQVTNFHFSVKKLYGMRLLLITYLINTKILTLHLMVAMIK